MTARRPLTLPALDPHAVPEVRGSAALPEPFRSLVAGRLKRRLGDACGLTQFGVNLVTLEPGAFSSVRHWHTHEDEFVHVLEGELVLVTDVGEQVLGAGMSAGFAAGRPDGHCLVNRSGAPARYLEIGSRSHADIASYPDDDLAWVDRATGKPASAYLSTTVAAHKNGKPYGRS